MKSKIKVAAFLAAAFVLQGCVFSPPVHERRVEQVGSTTTTTDTISATQRVKK